MTRAPLGSLNQRRTIGLRQQSRVLKKESSLQDTCYKVPRIMIAELAMNAAIHTADTGVHQTTTEAATAVDYDADLSEVITHVRSPISSRDSYPCKSNWHNRWRGGSSDCYKAIVYTSKCASPSCGYRTKGAKCDAYVLDYQE